MTKISWIQSGSLFRRMEGDISSSETLPVGIYEIGCGMQGWYLIRTGDKFTFNYKLYNLEGDFLDYVTKTYDSTSGNIGILFNGTRGTGKSVSAKVLANRLNLPIIIVKSMGEDNQNMISYIASFNFDCILFFDEFEKQFSEGDVSILQIMDGIYSSEYRRVFLLTTNELTINQNLLSRPSRIRYVRQFGNLKREIVEAYLDDNLKDLSKKDEVVDYVDTLTISTIDILKAIVEEINIHGFAEFISQAKSFNVQSETYHYSTIDGWITKKTYIDLKYSINDIQRELDTWKNRYVLDEEYHARISGLDPNSEEFERIRKDYKKLTKRNCTFEYRTCQTEKAWNKFNVGEIFGEDDYNEVSERVVCVDLERNIVVVEDNDYLTFKFIENPSAKPSLYKETTTRQFTF